MKGIDIIASGHEHTATDSAFLSENGKTIIFSPGEYGKYICRLDATYNMTRKAIWDYSFSLIPIDDQIKGDAAVQNTDIYLHFSGIRFDYDPNAFIFNRVKDIYLCEQEDPYTEQATAWLDTSDTQTLYRIVVNQYAFEVMEYTSLFGLPIIARDQNGDIIDPADRENYFIDASQEPGLQKLTEWMALFEFLGLHFPAQGQGIPQSLYGVNGSAMGRLSLQAQE